MGCEKRVMVVGSKAFTDVAAVDSMLGRLHEAWGKCVLVCGPGEHLAKSAAERLGWTLEVFSADFRDGRNDMGDKRHERMIASGVDLCIAFPAVGEVLTWRGVKAAHEAGIPVRIAQVKP